MKRFLLPLLIVTAPLHGQEEAPAAKEADKEAAELNPSQKAFSNLPEEQRKELATKFGEATRLFRQKRIFETLEVIDQAEKIFDQSAEVLNLKGSCYVEMRAFDKALEAFNKALEINPANVNINFNVAEVLFVTKKWKESHDLFQEILNQIGEKNMSLSRLIEFKILLCKIKLGQENEVVILAEKYDYQDDSPYYYYAQAALAYEAEESLEAEQWLARANRIFRDPSIIAPWQDTLVEYGYIKSFYGEDVPVQP